jgi:hypothetical protein
MPTRELEIVVFLRLDATLMALLTGGVYAESVLPEPGITDAAATPTVWTGGVFNPCSIVRERAPIPDLLVEEKGQKMSQAQAVEIYVYSRVAADLESAHDLIYALLQGHRFTSAWGARWWGSISNMRAPELPNVWMGRRDYRIVSIKVPIAV